MDRSIKSEQPATPATNGASKLRQHAPILAALLCLLCVIILASCGPEPRPGADATATAAALSATPDRVNLAAMTIEAALSGGGPTFTPTPATVDASTETPTPATPTPDLTQTAATQRAVNETATAEAIAALADTAATQEAFMATSVAATVAAGEIQAAAVQTAVAATLTAQATPSDTPDLAATQAARRATAIAQTLTAQPPPTDTPHPTDTPTSVDRTSALLENLRSRSRRSWVPRSFPTETDGFITALVDHLGEFALPSLGITTRTVTDALSRRGAEDRINGIVNQVWGDWLNKDVGPAGLSAYNSDPVQRDLSPFRQLVIRMIQGRQGWLVDNQQHAIHSLLTRSEERDVWVNNVNGVIGAINRESFLWP